MSSSGFVVRPLHTVSDLFKRDNSMLMHMINEGKQIAWSYRGIINGKKVFQVYKTTDRVLSISAVFP